MWKKNKLLFALWLLPFVAQSQQLTLDNAVAQSRAAFPLLKQQELLEQTSVLKDKNIHAAWMPTVTVNAQATYQSDVTSLPISMPGLDIPALSKDMYKTTLDIQQMVYDGGLSSAQRQIEEADLAIQKENLEAELKKIELMTADVYFSILSLQKSREQMLLMQNELTQQISTMESRVKNGVVLQSSLDLMRVEQLTLQQKISELDGLLHANINMLSVLLNQPLDFSVQLQTPTGFDVSQKPSIETPEFLMFDLTKSKLSCSEDALKVRNMPMVAAFAQVGYGRPGLNMFTTEFDAWYMVGIKASWSLWKGGINKREGQMLQIQQQMVETQQQAYITKLELTRNTQWQKIENLQTQLSTDEEILTLRVSIVASYASQLENGVITATDFLNQLNSKTIAAITLDMHRIQLLKEKYNYLRTFGK